MMVHKKRQNKLQDNDTENGEMRSDKNVFFLLSFHSFLFFYFATTRRQQSIPEKKSKIHVKCLFAADVGREWVRVTIRRKRVRDDLKNMNKSITGKKKRNLCAHKVFGGKKQMNKIETCQHSMKFTASWKIFLWSCNGHVSTRLIFQKFNCKIRCKIFIETWGNLDK